MSEAQILQDADASLARSTARSLEIEAAVEKDPSRFRILTGDRPTGNLHIGHYFGSLQNRVTLADKGVETMVLIADYQVITDRDGVGPIRERVYSLLTDYLAAGLDPEKVTIFTHSSVPGLNQLMLPFLSIVTDAELRRNPTVKSELDDTGDRPMSGLMLTYPVHQAADILSVKGNIIPVGKDQLPHLELTRKLARRFNTRFPAEPAVFPEPDALLSETPVILGLDGGQKMSKSRGNAVMLKATAEEIGDGGGGGLKKLVTAAVNDYFAPLRARRAELAADPAYLEGVLAAGNAKANEIADQTLDEVRSAMQMKY